MAVQDRSSEWTEEIGQITYLENFSNMQVVSNSAAELAEAAAAESQKTIDLIVLENERLKAEADAAKAQADAAIAAANRERARLEYERQLLLLEQDGGGILPFN